MEYSIDTSEYLENILNKLDKVNYKYNKEHNFKIMCRVKKKKKNDNEFFEFAEKRVLGNRLDKLNKIRKKNKKKNNIEVDNITNLLNDDIMTSSTGKNNKRWKELTMDDKIEKFIDYFKYSKYKEEEDLYNKIKDLIQNNRIDYRKYIIYDRINQRIDELPIIKLNGETKKYELLTDIENKNGNKKYHKKKISKIIQIK